MSFDLDVSISRYPDQLHLGWGRELAAHGFDVEIYPRFEPATWGGGFLPFRVLRAPAEFVGMPIDMPVVSGFEVRFEADSASFRTASGRTTTEFSLQCFGAATLAILCGGRYCDPQNDVECAAGEAIVAAEREVRSFLRGASERELRIDLFPGWDALE